MTNWLQYESQYELLTYYFKDFYHITPHFELTPHIRVDITIIPLFKISKFFGSIRSYQIFH